MKKILRKSYLINLLIFRIGYLLFLVRGKTSYLSHISMINLYCITNGKFLEKFNRHKKLTIRVKGKSNFFKNLNDLKMKSISNKIKDEGYLIFDQKLDRNNVKRLKELSFNLKAKVGYKHVRFDPKNKISNIYKFNSHDLIKNELIQDLIMDPLLINIAGEYLESNPIFDFAAMWWSTDSKILNDDAAQDFHFDLDRTNWLKIFIYLTDVNDKNGPHCYISGSHKVGNKPQESLNKGYVRISDKELLNFYNKKDFKEVTGKAGTILFGDTSCWHKGKPFVKGNRLILQLEYTSSLFGLNTPNLKLENSSNKFRDFCKNNKFYSQNISLK